MKNCSKLKSVVAATIGVAASCTTAWGQVDLTGDGRIEVVFGEPVTNELVVLDGATGAGLWRRAGSDLFGWAASAHPDVSGDGLADVIVSAPGAGVGGPGKVQALRGFDGQVLWSCEFGAASAKFGLGLGVIPDQDSDGTADILVAMLSSDPSGETAVLLSGKTGAVLTTAAGPVAVLLDSTRRGTFKFRTKDLDGSGVVDVIDAGLVVLAAESNDIAADVDFSGAVDDVDLIKVIDEIVAPAIAGLTPGQYILLLLEDPLLYNDGFQLVALASQGFQPTSPSEPCAAALDAARIAALAWARQLISPPGSLNPFDWNVWIQAVNMLRDRFYADLAVLNACRAGLGLPPLTPPDLTRPNRPSPPPPPQPPPPTDCPLSETYPPPTPLPGSPQDPCFNQLQTNFLLCQACFDPSTYTKSYADCLERAKAIFHACRVQIAPL